MCYDTLLPVYKDTLEAYKSCQPPTGISHQDQTSYSDFYSNKDHMDPLASVARQLFHFLFYTCKLFISAMPKH